MVISPLLEFIIMVLTHLYLLQEVVIICVLFVLYLLLGVERSRNPDSILREVNELNEKGYKEITLLGKTLTATFGMEEVQKKILKKPMNIKS